MQSTSNRSGPEKDKSVPLSGPGSLIQSSLPVMDFTNQSVENQQVSSVLDLGCGDLIHISTIDHITNGTVHYTGVDVSEYILQENESSTRGSRVPASILRSLRHLTPILS